MFETILILIGLYVVIRWVLGLFGVGKEDTGGLDPKQTLGLIRLTTFSVMGHIAKADGHVSEIEIEAARQVMLQIFDLSEADRRDAESHFRAGTSPDFDLDEVLNLSEHISEVHDLLIRVWCISACIDGVLSPEEKRILVYCCHRLGVPRSFMEEVCAECLGDIAAARAGAGGAPSSGGQGLDWAYRTLGVDERSSDQEVKQAYARQMKDFHPDKLVSKGLPEEMLKFASEKTKDLTRAYQQIKDARGL